MGPQFYGLTCLLAQAVSGQHALVQRDIANLAFAIANEENQ